MPAMHFELRWPDATQTRCYSPSLVIKDYFQPGTSYPLPQFMTQVREALNIASERVRAKFGFACSSAMDQLAQLEQIAQRFETVPSALVQVVAFHA
ncbi:MSMEG_0570 family nitrogen starvation response protein [Polaromonas naphthalenivorans]|uniref:MSMEG_0570 family protein n=1 Tax=Polaromonas naphthalenivorans (strain CJ2) TaxID=365044 RepID=A1VP30_POLNA|nr:MSMEG_0570 family nitrogen starvation response protein [Polaromonas naphthalenivorans]ABM37408.1 conserved hypothetical protein [Polaromonas naphthalenivorans CJ2]